MQVRWPAVFLLTLLPALLLSAADSGAYRGPDNSGVYPEKGLLKEWPAEGPKLLWKQPLEQGYANVSVISGLVYIAHGLQNHLDVFTLDGQRTHHIPTGSSAWKRFSGTRSTPVVEGDVAVVTTPDANVYGVDLKAGNVRWQLNAWKSFGSGPSSMGWGLPESPMHHNGTVVFSTCSRSDQTPPVVAVDAQSGRTVWGADAGRLNRKYSAADVSGACFNHNGRQFVVYPTWRYLLCLDAETGRRLWEIPDTSEKTLTPCYSEGRLLWNPAGKTQMLRLSPDGATYDVLWTRHSGVVGFSHAVVLDGRAYLFGSPHMRARTQAEQAASLDDEGTVWVPTPPDESLAPESVRTNGPRAIAEWKRNAEREVHLLCLDAETGRLLKSRPATDPGHIVAADGMVYVLELVSQGPDKPILPRVSLLKPTSDGFVAAGTLIPPLEEGEVCWDSYRNARNAQFKQWSREDFLYQRHLPPVIAEGRLFLRHGPLQVYDLRSEDWKPQRTRVPPVPPGTDETRAGVMKIAESAPAEARQSIMDMASRFLDERTNAVLSLAALPPGKAGELPPILVRLLDVGGARAWPVQQCALAALQTQGSLATPAAQKLRGQALAALDAGNGHLAEAILATLQQVNASVLTQTVVSAADRLASQDPAVRRQTVAALKAVGPAAAPAAEALAGCLASADRRMVNHAAELLRKLGSDGRSGSRSLQAGLTNAIAMKDRPRVELIAGVLESVDTNAIASCAAKIAIRIGDGDPAVAGLAVRTLNRANVTSVEAVPQLVAGMKSGDPALVQESVLMLARLGPRAASGVDGLVQYVATETGSLRVAATELLGTIGPDARAGVAPLSAGVRSGDPAFARASAAALGKIGADAAPAMSNLVAALSSRDAGLVRASAAALGMVGRDVSDRAELPLVAALKHGDEAVRTNAVAALIAIGRDPVPHLLALLRGSDVRNAACAASALGKMGSGAKAAVPHLVQCVRSRDGRLASASVEALGGIGPDSADALPELLALARGADRRLGETIQSALDKIKVDNIAPAVADTSAKCEEGKTVGVPLPVADPDDWSGALTVSVAQGPAHGSLSRISNTQFVYRASYGSPSEDVFIWRAGDRRSQSGAATAVITVVPDKTPPALTRVTAWTNASSIRLEFNEPLLTTAATNLLNYRVEYGAVIRKAELDTNGTSVVLYVERPAEGTNLALSLRNLPDRSRAANALTTRISATWQRPAGGTNFLDASWSGRGSSR